MANVTITDLNGQKYTIQSQDFQIDAAEIATAMPNAASEEVALITNLLDGTTFFNGDAWDFSKIVQKAGEVSKPEKGDPQYAEKVDKLLKRAEALQAAKGKLEQKKAGLEATAKDPKAGKGAKDDATTQLKIVNDALNTTNQLLKSLAQQLKQAKADATADTKEKIQKFLTGFEAANKALLNEGVGEAKFATSTTFGPQAQAPAPQGKAAGGYYPGGPAYPVPPGGGMFGAPAMGMGFQAAFDPSAWYQSSLFLDNKLAALDAVGEQQLKSQKMMLLFFYFARMAMSGDLGAMYQFMRFIGTIITRDKATQNIQLAEKLIQLQDASRKATDQLLKQNAYDPDDPQVSADFNKLMERTKADQGMIATDQKLIAQMLEEMSQVSEMMTGMTKSLLDARGREMNLVSVWRA